MLSFVMLFCQRSIVFGYSDGFVSHKYQSKKFGFIFKTRQRISWLFRLFGG